MPMQALKNDKIVALLFAMLTAVTIFIFFTDKVFFEWSFDRHHNILIWYIHPLFILPTFLGAYKNLSR